MTVFTPSCCASRAVSFISSAARWRTPSGSPSPQTCDGQDAAVPLVDRVVADGLALEVVGDRVDLEVVLLEQVELALDVAVVVPAPGVEVVAPAGDLEAVVAPPGGELGHLLERQVGPLAGEQGDRSGHERLRRSLSVVPVPASAGVGAGLDRGRARAAPAGRRRTTGVGSVPAAIACDEVDGLVGEAVLVAEHVARRPPGGDVGVLGSVTRIRRKPAVSSGAVASKNSQDVQVLEVEGEAPRDPRPRCGSRSCGRWRSGWPRRRRARRRRSGR